MNSADFRRIAREKLNGKWGKAALISLIYVLFYFALSLVEGWLHLPEFLINIVDLIIQVPVVYGLTFVFLKLFNSEETSFTEIFSLGFTNFVRSWKIQLFTLLKMLVLVIMLIASFLLLGFGVGMSLSGAALSIGGASAAVSEGAMGTGVILLIIAFVALIVISILFTMKSYFYKLAIFIGIDNPNMPEKEVVAKSEQLMTGKRGKLFVLELSFIGWALLSAFTFGIGILWLLPYTILAQIAFYKHFSGSSTDSNESQDLNNNFDDTLNLGSNNNDSQDNV